MSRNLQPLHLSYLDLSPFSFKSLARRQFEFLAWYGALAVALWVPAAAQTRAATAITLATTAAGKTVTTVTSLSKKSKAPPCRIRRDKGGALS